MKNYLTPILMLLLSWSMWVESSKKSTSQGSSLYKTIEKNNQKSWSGVDTKQLLTVYANGNTILHSLVYRKDLEMVKHLLDRYQNDPEITPQDAYAIITTKKNNQQTPYDLAYERYSKTKNDIYRQIAVYILNATNALEKHKNQELNPTLQGSLYATQNRLIQSQKKHKKKKQTLPTSRPEKNYTLIYAVLSGAFPLVEYAVDKDIKNIYETDSAGNTALHEAARKNYLEITEYLLSKIPSNQKGQRFISKKNKDKKTAADIARELKHKEVYALLENACLKKDELRNGGEQDKESQQPNNASVYVPIDNENGATKTIHYHAGKGNLDEIKKLAENNEAVLKEVNEEGNTPLHCAAENDQLEVVKFLLEAYKNDIDTILLNNKKGKKAAALAAHKDHREVFKCIWKKISQLKYPELAEILDKVI